jgi:hypothetical protein
VAGPRQVFAEQPPHRGRGGLVGQQPVDVRRVELAGQRDERDVAQLQRAQALRQAEQRLHGAKPRIGGQRLRGRVGEPVERHRVAQRARAHHLLDQGRDEHLLHLDATEVAAVADAVPVADERQRLVARDHVQPGADVEVTAPVVDARRGHADLDPAKRVGHRPEPVEVHPDEVVDPDARHVLHGRHRARRAAEVHRRVEHRALLPGDDRVAADAFPAGRPVDDQVPRDRQHDGPGAAGVQVDEHRRV